eukprot:GHVO01039513.1.p1 GENE.GHVO01039513.1~~GHVO01039513.1.p1  ORF type:complete len:262 (+),score=29.90 GHVO01039513.1:252-1037(+)
MNPNVLCSRENLYPFRIEEIRIMVNVFPSENEEKGLLIDESKLRKAEIRLLPALKIDRFRMRAKCVLCYHAFDDDIRSVSDMIQLLGNSVRNVLKSRENSSSAVTRLLALVLRIVNFINAGSKRLGDTKGFSLTSFELMAQVKTVEGESFFQVLSKQIDKELWGELEAELGFCKMASSIPPAEIRNEIRIATVCIRMLEQEIHNHKESYENAFVNIMDDFIVNSNKLVAALEDSVSKIEGELELLARWIGAKTPSGTFINR